MCLSLAGEHEQHLCGNCRHETTAAYHEPCKTCMSSAKNCRWQSANPSLRFTFTIDHPGEPAAGISSYTDTVTVEVESGDPGGEEGEFAEFMLTALREWYDGAKVTTTKEGGK